MLLLLYLQTAEDILGGCRESLCQNKPKFPFLYYILESWNSKNKILIAFIEALVINKLTQLPWWQMNIHNVLRGGGDRSLSQNYGCEAGTNPGLTPHSQRHILMAYSHRQRTAGAEVLLVPVWVVREPTLTPSLRLEETHTNTPAYGHDAVIN